MPEKENEDEGKIRIMLRVRPFNSQEKSEPDRRGRCYNLDGKIISIPGSKFGEQNYKFKHIFPESSTQEEVFEKAKGLVDYSLRGYNSTIFAYGPTGSGKTYTLQGDPDKNDGIAQRSFRYLYEIINEQANEGCEFKVSCTMVQIYYTDIDDLLEKKRGAVIRIEQDNDGLVSFGGACEVVCEDFLVNGSEEIEDIFSKGRLNRVMRATDENETSSRSHLIFTIKIEKKECGQSDSRTGKLHFIDLAGSESLVKVGNDPRVYEEGLSINESLQCLGYVIR